MSLLVHQFRRLTLPALLCLVPVLGWADLPRPHNFPGGIALVPIGLDERKPQVFFGLDPVLVIQDNSEWLAIVGLPMDIIPGKYVLRIEFPEDPAPQRSILSFTVYPLHSKYKQRSFTMPEKFTTEQFLGPENQQLKDMFGMHVFDSEPIIPDFSFQHVITQGSFLPYGRILSSGDHRDMKLENHSKITYLASGGAIAYAPGSGIVENIVDRGMPNQKILIRHSDHFRSILGYVKNSPLEIGDHVEAGQPIGTASPVDSSGISRVDWHLMLNGAEIDPLLLIEPAPQQE